MLAGVERLVEVGEPEVAVGIVGGLAEGALAEAAEAVAGGVGLAGL
jgi:hypothetical protein